MCCGAGAWVPTAAQCLRLPFRCPPRPPPRPRNMTLLLHRGGGRTGVQEWPRLCSPPRQYPPAPRGPPCPRPPSRTQRPLLREQGGGAGDASGFALPQAAPSPPSAPGKAFSGFSLTFSVSLLGFLKKSFQDAANFPISVTPRRGVCSASSHSVFSNF